MRMTIRKSPGGRQFTFPIPYRIAINLFFRETWFKWVTHSTEDRDMEKYRAYVEAMDFAELRDVFRQLDSYDNLIIMEVESEDGTYIRLST